MNQQKISDQNAEFFLRGIFFFIRPTKLVQPFKSNGQSEIEKGTRSLDLSRVRRLFQKKSGRQTDKQFFFFQKDI